jgi:hypothetical protein
VIRTNPAPATLIGEALTERIARIKAHMQALGVIRHYTEVERELKARQQRLLGIIETPQPEDIDEPPPSGSFSLE